MKIFQNSALKNINQIYIELGDINNNENKKIHQKFNGLIGPILLFNDKIYNPLNVYQKINDKLLQGKYFLLGEIFNDYNDNKKKENFYLNYDSYHRILNNQKEVKNLLNEIRKDLKNLILYINPEVISNNLNFYYGNKFIFQDYQIYNNIFDIKNYSNTNKYEIKGEKNFDDIIMIHKYFSEFFVNNQMIDFLILNIEIIYNELLLFENNDINGEKYNLL